MNLQFDKGWLALGVPQELSSGITSAHNPTAFASSTPSSTWVFYSGATDNVTGIRSEFSSYTATTHGRVRIVDGSYAPGAGKWTIQALPDLSLSSVFHVPCFSFNLMLALEQKFSIVVSFFIFLIVCFRIRGRGR